MELIKEMVIYIVIPLIIVIFKIVWSKLSQLEGFYQSLPGYEHCKREFALKSEMATKQDIAEMLNFRFERFELRLINEGRIVPIRMKPLRLECRKIRRKNEEGLND